jgi:glyoxylase-like metal-dependent hydrolase (beta-lactamase superfamily II)
MTRAPSGFVEVADRVLVARYPQWDVNVGLVLGRDGAVVIDTRASSLEGSAVLNDVRRLGRDLTVTHVVNTHVHFDHMFGNGAFVDATVHAHDNVGRSWEAAAQRIKDVCRVDLDAGEGDAPQHGYTAADLVEVLETSVRGPDRTFGRSATIDLGDRAVTLAWAGRGHTDGDIAVHVPDTDALFLGDLVEESGQPSLGDDCWPLEWADTLTSHLVWVGAGTVVVPGHGHPVDLGFVERQRDDLAAVATEVQRRRRAGVSLDEALRDPSGLPFPVDTLTTAIKRAWEQPPS